MKPIHTVLSVLIVGLLVASAYIAGNLTSHIELTCNGCSISEESLIENAVSRTAYRPLLSHSIQYYYRGTVIKVVDGDTIDVNLDMGFDTFIVKRMRLSGINAPEMNDSTNGIDSKQALEKMILNRNVIINTHRDSTDRYGRFIATIFSDDGQVNVNEKMVKIGKAKIY